MSKYGEPWVARLGYTVDMTEGTATFWRTYPDEKRIGDETWTAMRERILPESMAMEQRQTERRDRAVACVNALAGIEDPEGAIAKARITLQNLHASLTELRRSRTPGVTDDVLSAMRARAEHALQMLTPRDEW